MPRLGARRRAGDRRTLAKRDGDGIEHFGAWTAGADMFIEEDLEHERDTTDEVDN